ncbi:hypothetical protein COCCADRAFT_38529 [Bipolaris zeicola 26-R-13]|uniref:Uncharacterized protein n=1 Tax=Cochliobolus carbonum (strain 26-R-13) TaxID=930089 RepID=W6Y7Q0_COCC2|nr:uncharacterized protein COCCADRAFT_38529 [Bipolaris zeicola 26-R-13]EUC31334.1 hypothetical protein COCCADRAFT_38529 [Bipolaris zeicola 26-R-13]
MPDDSAGDAMLPPIRPLPKPHRYPFVFFLLVRRRKPRWQRGLQSQHRYAVVSNMGPAMDAKQVRPQATLPCLARQGPAPKFRRRFLNAEPFVARNTATSDGGPAQTLPDSAHCAALVSKRWTMAPDKWIESTGARLRPRRRRPTHY